MLGVIIAVKAKALSEDWGHSVWMLQRTIESILAADSGDIRICVVCHEVPELPRDFRVGALTANLPVPPRCYVEMCLDKVFKISAGIKYATESSWNHVMLIDCDDLVSRSAMMDAVQIGGDGWYPSAFYSHAYGSRFVRKTHLAYPDTISSIVLRTEFLSFQEPPFGGKWFSMLAEEPEYCKALNARENAVCTLIAAGHMNYLSLLESEGHKLRPFSEPSHIVINHPHSLSHEEVDTSNVCSLRAKLGLIRRRSQVLAGVRPLTPSLRRDFSVPSSAQIPSRYKLGTVFER